MNMLRTILIALPLVVAAALTGCASDPVGEDSADVTGAATVSASAPITLANYVSHPRIKAIRDQVAAVDGLRLTKATNPGCDGSNDKLTDASGKIRKLVMTGGEGGFEGTTTVWYSETGKALFAFSKEADLTGEQTGDTKTARLTEFRVYFDADGKTLFQAVREGSGTEIEVALQTPDRLPNDAETIASAEIYADPAAIFAQRGCGTDNVERKP